MDADVTLDNNVLTLDGDRVTVGRPPSRPEVLARALPADVTSAQFAASAGSRGVRLVLGRQLVNRSSILGRLGSIIVGAQGAFRVHMQAQFDHPIRTPDVHLQSARGYQSLVQRLLTLEAQLESLDQRATQLEATSHSHGGGGGPGGGPGGGT